MTSTPTPTRRSLMDDMRSTLPEGEHGSVAVRHFTVEKDSLANLREAMVGRSTRPGTYTMLTRNGHLWMSDTDAERADHIGAALMIQRLGGRVLIGGLGLGCILQVALLTPEVEHVEVVEIDPDVIALVGPHMHALAREHGKTLTIHQADLFTITWPVGTRWQVVWLDIWPDLCTDNLAEMAKLRRSYGRRSDWNDCWGREILLRERRRDQNRWW